MKANIISIGNELLIGQVINTNASWLGQTLSDIGWEIGTVICVADDDRDIRDALARGFDTADVVITTGGLGPTKDDITKKAVADYYGREMVFHEETWHRIEKYFTERKYPISELHRQQCYMPAGSVILENALGTAPGLRIEENGKACFVLPGVPYEMKYITETHIVPWLVKSGGVEIFRKKTFHTVGTGESMIADHIEAFSDGLPTNASIAYLPSIGKVRIRLSMMGGTQEEFDGYCRELRDLLDAWYYGEDDTNLEKEVARLMDQLELKLVLAESCTGGNISARLVQQPGASSYYLGGAVTYSYEHKSSVLGVSPDTLLEHGAVSEEVVTEMVQGALQRLGGDVAAAVSGIAGPDGGLPQKPVGTTWIAVGNKDKIIARKIVFNKDRSRNIEFSTIAVLNLIRKFLIAVYLK